MVPTHKSGQDEPQQISTFVGYKVQCLSMGSTQTVDITLTSEQLHYALEPGTNGSDNHFSLLRFAHLLVCSALRGNRPFLSGQAASNATRF
jgi:hypothetical protein